MKRRLETALIGILLLHLSACGKPSESKEPVNAPEPEAQVPSGSVWRLNYWRKCGSSPIENCTGGFGFSVFDDGKYLVGPADEGQALSGEIEHRDFLRLRQAIEGTRIGAGENCDASTRSQIGETALSLTYLKGEVQLLRSSATQFCFKTESAEKARQVLFEMEILANRYYRNPFPGPPKEPKPDPGPGPISTPPPQTDPTTESYRMDCRYRNKDQRNGINFCSVSASYRFDRTDFHQIRVSFSCDHEVMYTGPGAISEDLTLDRVSPDTALLPSLEVYPPQHLHVEGTYTSILDIESGRLFGNCTVQRQ